MQEYHFLKNAYTDDHIFHHKPCEVPSEPFDRIGKLCIAFQLLRNFQKSKALNIPIPESSTRYHKSNFPMNWETSYIRYLSTNLPRNLEDTFQDQRFTSFVSDQTGSVNLVGVLFIVQQILIKLPFAFLFVFLNCQRAINRTFTQFIWAQKQPEALSLSRSCVQLNYMGAWPYRGC